ncbi:hypothetical protein CG747_31030 [Streptomyces sp. CB02959]|uniref:hypothetical protein n=1 Tax=Streptomyces sp. CB02959 TaxID=2020330 RepID=UPI000C26FE74|nr:hypothetical protein [Streptomyces sp. CB02959]PJN37000.1 hypothetical protein CG747_31030 [Streptomyces sp. CB02959]
MASPARTPYSACADEGAQLDAALKAVGIDAPPSTVSVTEDGGVRVSRVAPPLLTPSQTARLARIVRAARAGDGRPDDLSVRNADQTRRSLGPNAGKRTDGSGRPCSAY